MSGGDFDWSDGDDTRGGLSKLGPTPEQPLNYSSHPATARPLRPALLASASASALLATAGRLVVTVEFLQALWPTRGIYIIETGPHPVKGAPSRKTLHQRAFDNIGDAAAYCMRMCSRFNVYFGVHSFGRYHQIKTKSGRVWDKVARTQENAAYARALYLDLDVGPESHKYSTQGEAMAALKVFRKAIGLPTPMLVNSGRGLHVYWPFDDDVPSAEWEPAAELLKRLAAHHGLLADPVVTADAARIMRPAGTFNRKATANPLRVEVWHSGSPPTAFSTLVSLLQHAGAGLPPGALPTLSNAVVGQSAAPSETPENVEAVRGMLDAIDPDVSRDDWRRAVWGVASLGWNCGEALAHEWSARGDKFEEGAFATMWAGFDRDRVGGVTWRTLSHLAIQHGYVGPNLTEAAGATDGIDLAVADGAFGKALEAAASGTAGDVANGRRFAAAARNRLLYIHDTGGWLRFDSESGWLAIPALDVEAFAKAVVRAMAAEVAELFRTNHENPEARRLRQNVERVSKLPHLRAMIEMAKSEPGMSTLLAEFDADPMLLGVQNGVIDLRTGELRQAAPDLRVSKRCSVAFDPMADCARYRAFMAQIQPDPEVREFILRFIGYCLTGSVEEQVFAFLYGGGFNGKSVLVELVASLLGDYARKISTEMLMLQQRSAQGPDPDVLSLKGTRFAYASETEDGRRLSEARVKDMTGGESLTARAPYATAPVQFMPTFKLAISGQHRPTIGDTSFGMWRRVILMTFAVTIPEAERVPRLAEKLVQDEGSGILNTLLGAMRDWRLGGLKVPPSIKAATAAYRAEQDVLGEFLTDHCETGVGFKVDKPTLHQIYRDWCFANGHQPVSATRLTRDLGDRGLKRSPDRRFVLGLRLRA